MMGSETGRDKMPREFSSLIQTVLSAPESHRISQEGSRAVTAGRELHPAPKKLSGTYYMRARTRCQGSPEISQPFRQAFPATSA